MHAGSELVIGSIQRRLNDIVTSNGSTRPIGLIRIALPAIMWAEWGNQLLMIRNLGAESMIHSAAFFVFTVLMMIGVWSRTTTFISAMVLYYYYYRFGVVLGEDDIVHHHTYILMISTLLLSFTPCGRSYSFDRYRAVAKARAAGESPPPERGPLWASALMGFQVSMIYFWGAYQKTTLAYMSGYRPQQIVMHHYTGADYPPFVGFALIMLLAGVGTVALEYGLAFGLWVRRLQPYLMPIGLVFHWFIYATMPVGSYTVTICLLYLVYLDPDRVHAFLEEMTTRE